MSSPGAPNFLTPVAFHSPPKLVQNSLGRALPTWPRGGGAATWRRTRRIAGSLGYPGRRGRGRTRTCTRIRIRTSNLLEPGLSGGALLRTLVTVGGEWVPFRLYLSHQLAGFGEVPTSRVPGPSWALPPPSTSSRGPFSRGAAARDPPQAAAPRSRLPPVPLGG